ncbi:homocysteine S-methyltransferase family protein [Lachnospiraceae bacterium ZAX-1]
MGILEFTKHNILVIDGAMGTMLQNSGLKVGENPEVLNITSPGTILDIHTAYFAAGANIVTTNTFGANAHKLSHTDYTPETIISHAVAIAKQAAAPFQGFVALDIGPIGELLEPIGTLAFEDAYELFKMQVLAGASAGADAVFIETMTDLYEMKAAVLAVKENCSLPVFCTMSFEESGRTFLNTSIPSMGITLEGLGADFIGINCSLGPAQIYPMIQELIKWTNLPIVVQPNAGLPIVEAGETIFNVTPEQFAQEMQRMLDLGVGAVGGCCGTTPAYTKLLKNIAKGCSPNVRAPIEICAVCSPSKTVLIDRVRIIGERINPTGKKKFKQALIDHNIDYILTQAVEQTEAGADILDVNVGLPQIDECLLMTETIKEIQGILDTPLQIDSTNVDVVKAALRIYNGKAVVNSVNGDDETLDALLPIIKKYGAAVVGLTLDKHGIPRTAKERFLIAKKIVDKAQSYGIPKSNVFIDCLTLTSSAEQALVFETIKAVALVKEKLGVKTVLGVSNISFGLPSREILNQVFLAAALTNGLDLPIINPNIKEMVDTIYCFHQLNNIDVGSNEYIERFRNQQQETSAQNHTASNHNSNNSYTDTIRNTDLSNSNAEHLDDKDSLGYHISFAIKKGLKKETKNYCQQLLETLDGLTVINEFLIPTLDEVGKDYESGILFLPQLLQSAEAAKVAFELVKQQIAKTSDARETEKKTIILATVQGDIHDIGKNIVKVILENYGYDVLDLGKDVEIQSIVDAAITHKVGLVGLSALMTTTVPNMELTIERLRAQLPDIKVMVGGAVLTADYAKKINADSYGKDAMAAVLIAEKHFETR